MCDMVYDVAFSFAGEDRQFVEQVYKLLKDKGILVFYDNDNKAALWGKNLVDYLTELYDNRAKFVVIFISKNYAEKVWTNVEREAALAKAIREKREYILPARFDETSISGVLDTIGYIDLKEETPESFARLIEEKLLQSGFTIPSYELRKPEYSFLLRANSKSSKLSVTIVDDQTGAYVANACVVLFAQNGTYLMNSSDDDGCCSFDVKLSKEYSIIVAHPEYRASMIEKLILPPDKEMKIEMRRDDKIGSIVIQNVGYISGLKGRLNPILDSNSRIYLYADNIAINGGKNQPVDFKINEVLQVEDSDGTIMNLLFRFVGGHTTALIEFVHS